MNKLEQALDYHKTGELEKSKKLYLEILTEEPDNIDILYLYSTLLVSMNQLQESLVTIDKAIELNDKAPAFYQLKGSILARQGQSQEALETLELALKDNPNLYQGQVLAGHLNYTLGSKEKAKSHFKSAIKINETHPEAHVNLAKIMIDEGKIEKSINTLRDIELKNPEQSSVKMMLGQAFLESGSYSYAESYFQKVLDILPDYDMAKLFLGVAKLETGDIKTSEKNIPEFNQKFPNTKEGLAAMGMLLFKHKRFGAAAQHLTNAIGNGYAPLSWKSARVESIVRLGDLNPAINFYKERLRQNKSGVVSFRLGELYEKQGKYKKATKLYKDLKPQDLKYTSAQLGIAKCYLLRQKPEKAEKYCKSVLDKTRGHAEASYLLTNSFFEQSREEEAYALIQSLDLSTYNDTYKRVFNLLSALYRDNRGSYERAFEYLKSIPYPIPPEYRKMEEEEVKKVQKFDSEIDKDDQAPIFLVGSRSTGLNELINWLYQNDIKVLNDRLVSFGRQDILHSSVPMDKLESADKNMVELERKLFKQKAMAALGEENTQIVDSLSINPYQIGIVKKFFPDSKIVLLKRDTPDIWLSQQAFGPEIVSSEDWNEAKNQIISMGLNLIQVDVDDWMENKEETLTELETIFGKELKPYENNSKKYWAQNRFPKGHWKNYTKFLGK